MMFLLDADEALGTNAEITEAIDASLTKMDISIDDTQKEIMSNLCADFGGGGTREGLENKFIKQGRTCSLDFFLATKCVHHIFNFMMASILTKFFGGGRIQTRSLLQLLWTCYAIQKKS